MAAAVPGICYAVCRTELGYGATRRSKDTHRSGKLDAQRLPVLSRAYLRAGPVVSPAYVIARPVPSRAYLIATPVLIVAYDTTRRYARAWTEPTWDSVHFRFLSPYAPATPCPVDILMGNLEVEADGKYDYDKLLSGLVNYAPTRIPVATQAGSDYAARRMLGTGSSKAVASVRTPT
eukprot:1207555-Rhodomonas_salina.3